jgi:hypothetical protein
MAQRGKAEDKKTRRQAVVQRSVTMSSTAPKRVACWNCRAAYPSRASRRQEMLYRAEQVRGCSGM